MEVGANEHFVEEAVFTSDDNEIDKASVREADRERRRQVRCTRSVTRAASSQAEKAVSNGVEEEGVEDSGSDDPDYTPEKETH